MYKKGSVIFRDVCIKFLPLRPVNTQQTYDPQYELVDSSVTPTGQMEEISNEQEKEKSKTQVEKERKRRAKARITIEHLDIIQDEFWEKRPWLLSNKPGIPK